MGITGAIRAAIWIASASACTMMSIHATERGGREIWRGKYAIYVVVAWSVSFCGTWWIINSSVAPLGCALHVFVAASVLAMLVKTSVMKTGLWSLCGFAFASALMFAAIQCLSAFGVIGR